MAKRNRSSDGKSRGKKHLLPQQEFTGKLPASIDPDDENSLYQDWSMQALQSRGVQFLSCHTAAEEQARVLFRRNKLSESPEDIVEGMLAHTQPGVLVVAAMTAALALLQAQGHYTYISV